jgi:hypothetical protein
MRQFAPALPATTFLSKSGFDRLQNHALTARYSGQPFRSQPALVLALTERLRLSADGGSLPTSPRSTEVQKKLYCIVGQVMGENRWCGSSTEAQRIKNLIETLKTAVLTGCSGPNPTLPLTQSFPSPSTLAKLGESRICVVIYGLYLTATNPSEMPPSRSPGATRVIRRFTEEQELFIAEHIPAYVDSISSRSLSQFLNTVFFPLWFERFPEKANEAAVKAVALRTQKDVDEYEHWLRERKRKVGPPTSTSLIWLDACV